MFMKTFLIMLQNSLKKDHPDVVVELYVSRRSKFAHMGIDVPLNKISNHEKFIEHIENFWNQKKTDNKFRFVNPYLINCTKFKFDYIIFEKNYWRIFFI